MTDIYTIEERIKDMIDDLKGICQTYGLANQASEETVITSVFLYKFLNDKFMWNLKAFSEEVNMPENEILEDGDMLEGFYDAYPQDVAFKYPDTIQYLINKTGRSDFYKLFDEALERISGYPQNEEFGIETTEGSKKPLFTKITNNVEDGERNNFAVSIFGTISTDKFDFSEAFGGSFDFYSTIFEYLIKDYNVASGVYAEYFTPQAISSIIAKILVEMSPVEDKIYDIYDPSAGSGSLILHLANALGKGKFGNKAQVYTQDISNKSTRFLRINMLLNGLTNSLDNIIKGDTLLTPAHYNVPHDPSSGVKQFDYITANPPFNMDFSSSRDEIESKWADSEKHDGFRRFFAGVPKIPAKKKTSMAIYLCFVQHILWSLKDDGKAAIVVPTIFLTATQDRIAKQVRHTIVDKHWLKGVISMPSNIFANTGTNVSVLFIDKSNKSGNIMLLDASKLGEKSRREGKNQKTVLRPEEIKLIENAFIHQNVIDDFSVSVTYNQIVERNYSLAAGQYFEVKIEYVELTPEEFNQRMNEYTASLDELFEEGEKLEVEINRRLGELKYE